MRGYRVGVGKVSRYVLMQRVQLVHLHTAGTKTPNLKDFTTTTINWQDKSILNI